MSKRLKIYFMRTKHLPVSALLSIEVYMEAQTSLIYFFISLWIVVWTGIFHLTSPDPILLTCRRNTVYL